MTLQESVVAREARIGWLRLTDTQLFRAELQKDYADTIDKLVSAGNTPGTALEVLVRHAARAKQLRETIEKLCQQNP